MDVSLSKDSSKNNEHATPFPCMNIKWYTIFSSGHIQPLYYHHVVCVDMIFISHTRRNLNLVKFNLVKSWENAISCNSNTPSTRGTLYDIIFVDFVFNQICVVPSKIAAVLGNCSNRINRMSDPTLAKQRLMSESPQEITGVRRRRALPNIYFRRAVNRLGNNRKIIG